jgi:hypothetical protein
LLRFARNDRGEWEILRAKNVRVEMDNNKKLVEGLLRADGIDPAGAGESERAAFGKMLDEQLKPGLRADIWRKIVHSKMTKFAAAAVIIMAMLIGINWFGGSVDVATIAFAEISEAMKKVPWMHMVSTGFERGLTGPGEQWFGFERGIFAYKSADGAVRFINMKEHKSYSYDFENQTIAISYISESDIPINLSSPDLLLESMHKTLKEQGAEIITKEAEYNGRKVQLQEISQVSGEENKVSSIVRLYIEPASKLLLAAKVKGTNAEGEVIMDGDITFSYPDTGPLSIYDLGVPASAKIVNNSIPGNIDEILKKYEGYRKMEPSRYASIAIIGGSAEIMFKDGELTQTEKRFAKNRSDWDKQSKDLGSNFESLLKWWMNNDNGERYDAVYIYDGTIDYFYSPTGKVYRVDGHNTSHRTLNDYGWPDVSVCMSGAGKESHIIETDYSKEGGLICIEVLAQGRILDGGDIVLPNRSLYYLAPGKDYMCVRYEYYYIRDASWQKDKTWLANIDSNKIPSDPYVFEIDEVMEFAQTDNGGWYPKKIKKIYCDTLHTGGKERISYQDIYLNTNPTFPEGIFDVAGVPQ